MKKNCKLCGKPFKDNTKSGNKKYCSSKCGKKVWQADYYKRHRDEVRTQQRFNYLYWTTLRDFCPDKFIKKAKLRKDRDGYLVYCAGGTRLAQHRAVYMMHNSCTASAIKGYDIHHKDGDKTNNIIENLTKVLKSDHAKMHRKATKRGDAK